MLARLQGWDIAEMVLLGTALPLYYLARGLVPVDVDASVGRAEDVIALEKSLGIFWEAELQEWVLPYDWVVDALNAVYLWGHLPVIGAIAFWLYLRHRSQYYLLRNALFLSGVIGLVVYFSWTVAPPRLTPGFGFVDTIADQYGVQRPGTPGIFINHYAAIPSLHFGWNVLAAGIAPRAVRNPVTWGLAILVPPVTLASILLTANHFILDAVAGLAAVLVGLIAALAMRHAAERLEQRGGSDGDAALLWLCGVDGRPSHPADTAGPDTLIRPGT